MRLIFYGGDLKSDFYLRLAMTYPDIYKISDKQMKYKAITKSQGPRMLKNLGFFVHKMFNNRE